MTARRGFALVAVLWVTVALIAIAAGGAVGARLGSTITSNRVTLARGRWAAEGCLAVAQVKLDSGVRANAPLGEVSLDTIWLADGAACTAAAVDPGTRLNAARASREMVARFDSAVAADGLTPIHETLLTLDGDGRINLNAAPAPVLAALPGLGPEAIRVVLERRDLGDHLSDLFQVIAYLTPAARDAMLARYADLGSLISWEATSLVVTATGWVPGERPAATVQEVVVPAGSRVAVVRRRVW